MNTDLMIAIVDNRHPLEYAVVKMTLAKAAQIARLAQNKARKPIKDAANKAYREALNEGADSTEAAKIRDEAMKAAEAIKVRARILPIEGQEFAIAHHIARTVAKKVYANRNYEPYIHIYNAIIQPTNKALLDFDTSECISEASAAIWQGPLTDIDEVYSRGHKAVSRYLDRMKSDSVCSSEELRSELYSDKRMINDMIDINSRPTKIEVEAGKLEAQAAENAQAENAALIIKDVEYQSIPKILQELTPIEKNMIKYTMRGFGVRDTIAELKMSARAYYKHRKIIDELCKLYCPERYRQAAEAAEAAKHVQECKKAVLSAAENAAAKMRIAAYKINSTLGGIPSATYGKRSTDDRLYHAGIVYKLSDAIVSAASDIDKQAHQKSITAAENAKKVWDEKSALLHFANYDICKLQSAEVAEKIAAIHKKEDVQFANACEKCKKQINRINAYNRMIAKNRDKLQSIVIQKAAENERKKAADRIAQKNDTMLQKLFAIGYTVGENDFAIAQAAKDIQLYSDCKKRLYHLRKLDPKMRPLGYGAVCTHLKLQLCCAYIRIIRVHRHNINAAILRKLYNDNQYIRQAIQAAEVAQFAILAMHCTVRPPKSPKKSVNYVPHYNVLPTVICDVTYASDNSRMINIISD